MRMRPVLLWVDDESGVLEVGKEALGELFTVVAAPDGQAALDLLEQTPVDCIVTDLRMPRMGGRAFLQAVKERGHGPAVVVLTGYGDLDDAVECVKLGASAYLLKPFRIDKLTRALFAALEERAERQSRLEGRNLSKMLAFSESFSALDDKRALVREFLSQVNGVFSPDGVILALSGPSSTVKTACQGPLFTGDEAVERWWRRFAKEVLDRGGVKLFDESKLESLHRGGERVPPGRLGSVLAAPLFSTRGRLGAAVLVRLPGRGGFSLADMNLLSVFCAHAASRLENLRLNNHIEAGNRDIVLSYARAVEAKDVYTRGHSERVSRLAVELGERLGLCGRDLSMLADAALLHDIGKIGAPDSILNKEGPLTEEERAVMRRHPEIGRDILSQIDHFEEIGAVVAAHHERYDGLGYPLGLSGDDIPFMARIVGVVDVFEALTSTRSYRSAGSVETALGMLERGAGLQWDPRIVSVFAAMVRGKNDQVVAA